MSNKLTATKEPVATIMAIFAVAQKVVNELISPDEVDSTQIDTIITNKILHKCEELKGGNTNG